VNIGRVIEYYEFGVSCKCGTIGCVGKKCNPVAYQVAELKNRIDRAVAELTGQSEHKERTTETA